MPDIPLLKRGVGDFLEPAAEPGLTTIVLTPPAGFLLPEYPDPLLPGGTMIVLYFLEPKEEGAMSRLVVFGVVYHRSK